VIAIQGMIEERVQKILSFGEFSGVILTFCVLLFLLPRKARNTRKSMEVWSVLLRRKTVSLEITTDPEMVLLCHKGGGD